MQRILLLGFLCLPISAMAELMISDAWIKNLPASVPVRAGYMLIRNSSAKPLGIIEVRSAAFEKVEIHKTVARDGMMSMEAVQNLLIDSHESVQLAPGGLHLMMMRPHKPTRPGEILEIVILLDDGREIRVPMTVKK